MSLDIFQVLVATLFDSTDYRIVPLSRAVLIGQP